MGDNDVAINDGLGKEVPKMFQDFIAVMLINLAAGLALLAHYIYVNPEKGTRKSWAAGFFATGFLGLLTSFAMIVMWPLPGSYNVAFGEPALLLSVAFLAAAITLTFEWEPLIPAIYGAFGGLAAIIVGIRLADLHMTQSPTIAMLGYVTAGIGGILVMPALQWRKVRGIAIITAIILGIAAVIWAITGYEAIWGHIADFSKWLPATMLQHTGK